MNSPRVGFGLAPFAFALLVAGPAMAQDSDGDGTADSADALPCDATVAAISYQPAQDLHGLMIVEDEWPLFRDFDANDVVIAYNYELRTNTAGEATLLRVTYSPLAIGGLFVNGLKLHVPVPVANIASVTRRVGTGMATTLTPSTQDAELTVTVSSDLRELFGGQQDQINSLSTIPRLTGETIQVDITFTGPVTLAMSEAPFDPFIFRTGNPGYEIHLPTKPGSASMDGTIFGTGNDGTGNGRYYVYNSGLPAALLLPTTAEYPTEGIAIDQLYPDVVGFASSGGTTNPDFYTSTVNASFAYKDSNGLGAPAPTFLSNPAIDTSCINQGTVTPAVPGFTGQAGPDYSSQGYSQCVGVFDQANVDDLPNTGWANLCADANYDRLRIACGTGPTSVRYIDVSRNVFLTGLNSYPETGLITNSNFSLAGGNDIYASGNQPNTGTSWWVNGTGCSETSPSITINNGCPYDASNCFGQNINGSRYLYVYAGVSQCLDGIQNQGETGVDCGGPCTACPTCSDGIQNQTETGVDCGGTCSACPTCTDGIQNGGETGVDCGGSCSACLTCTDGIQNQGETGIDCGGPCAACPTTVPGFSGQAGPAFSGWTQCVGYFDQQNVDDIPNSGWANACNGQGFTQIRVACGANASSVRYIDVSRNVLETGTNSYPETGLITNSNFTLGGNDIYASGNNPNTGTSWWVNGTGCSETSPSITINNGCPYDASNCFGQNISGSRYLYVYGQ